MNVELIDVSCVVAWLLDDEDSSRSEFNLSLRALAATTTLHEKLFTLLQATVNHEAFR